MRIRGFVRFVIVCLLAGAGVALGQAGSGGEYRLGPKDLVEVKVLEVPDLNVERRVNGDGEISLPLLGQISVQGLTAVEVAGRLEAILTAKYVNRANASVVIKEFANKPVSIIGAVTRPGSLNIAGRWDLLQAISAAGGLAFGSGRKIYVLRRAENGLTERLEIDTDDLFVRSSPKWNIPIFPSDIINVPSRTTVRIFCLGEVKSPGALEFDSDDRISLLSVIAKGGGLTDRAARGSIRIKRKGPDGRDVEIKADYKRIVSGKDPDPALKGDDVVIIKESFF